jgi:hypothetical protein
MENPMTELSTWRLYLMRALYLMMFLFLSTTIWPLMFSHAPWDMMHGVACSLLAALGAMALWGIRYPVKMLPILLFELLWKLVWVAALGIPLLRMGSMTADFAENMKACVVGVIFCLIAIPWAYVWRHYIRAPGDRWRNGAEIAR